MQDKPSKRQREARTCEACGAPFLALVNNGGRSTGQFCSAKCAARWRWRDQPRTACVCPTCGREFTALDASFRPGQRRYCSKVCADAYQRPLPDGYIRRDGRSYIERQCRVCGRTFACRADYAERHPAVACSPSCAGDWAAAHSPPLEERFWRFVTKNGPVAAHCYDLGPCWLWTGRRIGKRGYGSMQTGRDPETGKKRYQYAHRLSWRFAHGDLPDNKHVCHRCDNPRCVNPGRLFLGTDADNLHDMWRKGRAARGGVKDFQTNPDMVRWIRQRAAMGVSHRLLAEQAGLSYSAIHAIVRRRTWKHVD